MHASIGRWRDVRFLGWNFLLLFAICILFVVLNGAVTAGFNFDSRNPIILKATSGEKGLFGYSLSFHGYGSRHVVLVGAPFDRYAEEVSGVQQTGVLYACEVRHATIESSCRQVLVDIKVNNRFRNGTLKEEKSWMRLGSAILSTGFNRKVVVCAPGYSQIWIWVYLKNKAFNPTPNATYDSVGRCYVLPPDLDESSVDGTALDACHYFAHAKTPLDQLSQCTASNSISVAERRTASRTFQQVVFSGPYQQDGRGQIFFADLSESTPHQWTTGFPPYQNDAESLLGFALAQGDFDGDGVLELAASRPSVPHGTVWIISAEKEYNTNYSTHFKVTKDIFVVLDGSELQGFFGYAMAAADLDGDGTPELLVSAPVTTPSSDSGVELYDYGSVLVFGKRLSAAIALHKSETPSQQSRRAVSLSTDDADGGIFSGMVGSWFGAAIGSVGDIDQDGYEDVAIGAPFEAVSESSCGAVYIYMGSSTGIKDSRPEQRLISENLPGVGHLRGFGFSISRAWDFDGNGFGDIAIGAILSEKVVVLRARPVLDITVTLSAVNFNGTNATWSSCRPNKSDADQPCLDILICFQLMKPVIVDEIVFNYKISLSNSFTALQPETVQDAAVATGQFSKTAGFSTADLACEENKVLLHPLANPCETSSIEVSNWRLNNPPSTPEILAPVLRRREQHYPQPLMVSAKPVDCLTCKPDLTIATAALLTSDPDVQPPKGTGDPTLIVGVNEKLWIWFEISNQGDSAACDTMVKVFLPTGLAFSKQATDRRLTCSISANVEDVLCSLSLMLRANKTELFFAELDVVALPEDDELSVRLDVFTATEESDTSNNYREASIRVSHRAMLTLSSHSYQQQVAIKQGPYPIRFVADLGPHVTHEIKIYNNGPSSSPSPSVIITWPATYVTSTHLLYLFALQSDDPHVLCNHTKWLNPRNYKRRQENDIGNSSYKLHNVGEWAGDEEGYEECNEMLHVCLIRVRCYIPALAHGESTRLFFSYRAYSYLPTKNERRYLPLIANTTATLEEIPSSPGFVEIKSAARTAMASTEIVKAVASRKEELKWWVIFVACLTAIMVLLVIVFLLYKCGFFKRKRIHNDGTPFQ